MVLANRQREKVRAVGLRFNITWISFREKSEMHYTDAAKIVSNSFHVDYLIYLIYCIEMISETSSYFVYLYS